MDNEALQPRPAISVTLDRARGLRNTINQLAEFATTISNRVCGEPAPIEREREREGEDVKRDYSNNLVDTFLSIHDEMDQALVNIRAELSRLSSQV